MALRHPFQFAMHIFRIILQWILYIIYCMLYWMLVAVEACCWHVDHWMEDQITIKGSLREVSTWLQILNWILRRCWKVILRLNAVIYTCYMNTGESGRS